MPPTEDLGFEKAIVLSGDGSGIGLSADLDHAGLLVRIEMCYKRVSVERV
jgi:hypothetical protein